MYCDQVVAEQNKNEIIFVFQESWEDEESDNKAAESKTTAPTVILFLVLKIGQLILILFSYLGHKKEVK